MNLLLLKSNGRVIAKDEHDLSINDIESCHSILVNADTSGIDRLFIFAEAIPSPLLLFTKAVIDYQMGIMFSGDDDWTDFQEADPIHVETDSVTTLIGLLNSIDKINVINSLTQEEYSDVYEYVGVLYISVKLYIGEKPVYEKYYSFSGNSATRYDSYKISKKFKDIYNGDIAGETMKNKLYRVLFYKKKKLFWKKATIDEEYDMLLLPTIMSNMMILCNENEIESLRSYGNVDIRLVIYFANAQKINEVTNYINIGASPERIYELIEEMEDCFTDAHKLIMLYPMRISVPIDIMVNTPFVFNCLSILYKKTYESNALTYEFDCVLCLTLTKKEDKKQQKEIIMNTRTPFDAELFLANL